MKTPFTRIMWICGLCLAAAFASACNKNTADTNSNARATALVTSHSERADRPCVDGASAAEVCAACAASDATPCASCMRRPDASNCAQRALRGDAAPAAHTPTPRAPDYESHGAPAGTDALAAQLRARHAEDAPTGEALRALEGAEPALHFLAENGELMIERQRALAYLQHFPSDETRALLVRVASSEAQRAGLRTTALRSLIAISDPDDADVQNLRSILEAPTPDDARRPATTLESTTEQLP